MGLNTDEITLLARTLDDARLEAREMPRLTEKHPDLTLEDAYRIQDAGISRRLKQGEKLVGLKMGLTSESKRQQMGLHSPIYGVLTDAMRVRDRFSLKGKIHPKIEPEIAFLIDREVKGEITLEQALDACSGVTTALEILDSRFVGFKYFSLPDVVADNSSSAYFTLGTVVRKPRDLELDRLNMTMKVNGKPVENALSSAISGHPALSIVELCRILHSRGRYLPAGAIVLAGAATAAVPLEAGQTIGLEVEGFGEFSVEIDA